MTAGELMTVATIVFVVVVPMVLLAWLLQKKRLGVIRCRRCRYIGLAKGQFVPFHGIKPVCAECGSEDWVVHDEDDRPRRRRSRRV